MARYLTRQAVLVTVSEKKAISTPKRTAESPHGIQ